MQWIGVILIGALVGFLGGLFGKGGSAIATPLLAAIGIPPIVAVASPLPATIPSTLVAYARYRRAGVTDPEVVRWSIIVGAPATIVGAVATRWIDGEVLITVTELVVAAIGVNVLLRPEPTEVVRDVEHRRARLVAVAVIVGLLGGLLANAGGFLLVPLYLVVLKLPIKTGTAVHALLGHVDWAVTAVFATASIPLSSLGARTALRMGSARLERIYGGGLLVLGLTLFLAS